LCLKQHVIAAVVDTEAIDVNVEQKFSAILHTADFIVLNLLKPVLVFLAQN
jgi:hypothetical protein